MFSVVPAFVWFGNDNSALGTVTDHVHYDIDRSTGSFEVTFASVQFKFTLSRIGEHSTSRVESHDRNKR